jgi:Trk K+ transport system NAD-binding subunit
MGGLYFLLPTLLVILFSFLIVRAAAIALMLTGMEEKRARFQALSAFSGTGFTTKESELVVNHPLRRHIIIWLMLLGHAGVVTVIVTATSSVVNSEGYHIPIVSILLLLGVYLIYKLATHTAFTRRWENYVHGKLLKLKRFEEGTTEDLLHIIEGYGLVRVFVRENSPLTGKAISELKLPERGSLVLGIERARNWIPIPRAMETIREGDKLVVYGSIELVKDLLSEKEGL